MTRKQIVSRAGNLVTQALGRGVLKRQPCEQCGKTGRSSGPYGPNDPIHAHHDDYSEPLNVRWLCGSCHKRHHLKFGPAFFPDEIAGEAA